jgi:hypothetical protein
MLNFISEQKRISENLCNFWQTKNQFDPYNNLWPKNKTPELNSGVC